MNVKYHECMTMDKSKTHEPQVTIQAANPPLETHPITRAGRAVSDLLEDSGNRRQTINPELSLHLLSDSLFSEQQKLRHVLDWAHSFLSSGSETHLELCRADSLLSDDDKLNESPAQKHLSAAKYHCAICHKDSTAFDAASTLKVSHKTTEAQSERDTSGHQAELRRVKMERKEGAEKEIVREKTEDAGMGTKEGKSNEGQECSSACAVFAKNTRSSSEPEKPRDQVEKTRCRFKTPPTLTVYEQYQLYVDQLRHQHIEPGGSEQNSTIKSEIKKHLHKVGSERVADAETTKELSSDAIDRNQDRPECSRNRATLTEHCDGLTAKEMCAESRPEGVKGAAGGKTSTDKVIKTSMEHLGTVPGENLPSVEESAALTTNQGLFPKRIGHNPGVQLCQSGVKGQKRRVGGRGASLRLFERSSVSLSSPPYKEILQRPQSSGAIRHTKKHTPEGKVASSAHGDTQKRPPHTEKHTPLHDDPGPTSAVSGVRPCEQTDSNFSPAGVPVRVRWLCLPDEVWLCILSLLPHRDLGGVMQVCSRLHRLVADHTLWENVRVENLSLTERWLLRVGGRRPRSLCLYSCSGASLTSRGLEMFFTLCGNFLEELKVTSCTGPGLHGDQMLPLIGRLCGRVTSVDVSWSGATDTGVNALSDCCTGLQLKSVVLNGCHVTDDPVTKLVMRHKESLCRLEVFGCQFLTPSCLQTVYEMCPGLRHLNIGQVPKVTTHSLTVMTSQLRCLVSLNLTGLQAVTDAAVETLLQVCVELQSLTFSSCPGVTDLTLQSISKYTPCIRSLDVSGCKAVTDAGVHFLALGCRRLQQLDLSSTATGNRGVTLLANYCSGHLRTIKLSFCHITAENILKLCRRCRRLKVLHLYGCARLPSEREIRRVNPAVKVDPLS